MCIYIHIYICIYIYTYIYVYVYIYICTPGIPPKYVNLLVFAVSSYYFDGLFLWEDRIQKHHTHTYKSYIYIFVPLEYPINMWICWYLQCFHTILMVYFCKKIAFRSITHTHTYKSYIYIHNRIQDSTWSANLINTGNCQTWDCRQLSDFESKIAKPEGLDLICLVRNLVGFLR